MTAFRHICIIFLLLLTGCASIVEPQCEVYKIESDSLVTTGETSDCPVVVRGDK